MNNLIGYTKDGTPVYAKESNYPETMNPYDASQHRPNPDMLPLRLRRDPENVDKPSEE